MRFLPSQSPWWLLSLIPHVCGLSLLEALKEYPELSTLSNKVNAAPVLASLLGGADGFTFFAPTNAAIETFLRGKFNMTADAAFQAVIQYSLVKGAFPSGSFSNESLFIPTNLVDAKYSNVTGAQVVELVENGEKRQVISGNRVVSNLVTSDIVCGGGLIHIVDTALAVPAKTETAITSAHLSFFISILTAGGYLSRAKNQYVHELLDARDVTYFIPNSQVALSKFNDNAKAWVEEDLKKNFQYHVVPKYVGYSNGFKNGTSLKTAEGTSLTITIHGKDVYVNAAKVIATDILVSNGVIHVIDGLLDRFNTAPPVFSLPDSNRTAISSSSSTPTPTPSQLETQKAQSSTPTPSVPAIPIFQSSSSSLTFKVALGAGLGGAAILSIVAFFLFLRYRSAHRQLAVAKRDSGAAWDGHSMSTSPSDPKRYFVNNGSVQMRDRESVSPTRMIHVTNLEIENENERDAATRYHYQGKRGQPSIPMRSPSRLDRNGSHHERNRSHHERNGSHHERNWSNHERPERSYF